MYNNKIPLVTAFASISLSLFPCFAEKSKTYQKEADQIADQDLQEICKFLEILMSNPSIQEEILPEGQRGQTFDADLAAEQVENQNFPPVDPSIKEVVDTSLETYELEGTEPIIRSTQAILDSYQEGVGVEYRQDTPSEQKIETCQEGGAFYRKIEQKRVVTVIPEQSQTIITCPGHRETKAFHFKSTAKKKVSKWERELSKKNDLKKFDIFIEGGGLFSKYHVVKSWVHQDNFRCENHFAQNKIIPEVENDTWEADPQQQILLKSLESNINCKILQTKPLKPGHRTIAGRSIYRDSWERLLIFSCHPCEDSECQRIRNIGGEMINRTCLEKDETGECILWEKTYAIPNESPNIQKIPFKEKDFFDPEAIDTTYEKNTELPQVLATLSAISNIGNPKQGGFSVAGDFVFSGSSARCRRSFDSKNLFDCCYSKNSQGRGLCIHLDLGNCSKEEKTLFENVKEGKCHYIGRVKNAFMTRHVYCCYPTKLARIVQEEAHQQLGLSWGTSEEPKCRGLTIEQLQSLDFEAMDFTDFIQEFQSKIDPDELAKNLKAMTKKEIESISPESAEEQTKKILGIEQ